MSESTSLTSSSCEDDRSDDSSELLSEFKCDWEVFSDTSTLCFRFFIGASSTSWTPVTPSASTIYMNKFNGLFLYYLEVLSETLAVSLIIVLSEEAPNASELRRDGTFLAEVGPLPLFVGEDRCAQFRRAYRTCRVPRSQ